MSLFLISLLFILFGASIGSFVQVVVTRLNVAPIAKSRSKCLSCGEALRVSDLIPIFSYIFLGGKCRYCKSPYGIEALVVEGMYALVYFLLYYFILSGLSVGAGALWLLYYTCIFISLGVIALYDYKHSYVPTLFLASFSLLSIVMLVMRYMYSPHLAILLGPIIVALPFFLIWIFTKGRALGFGDIILFLAIGAFFDLEQSLAVLLISVWLGAIIGVVIYLHRRKNGVVSTAIPFVPFIVIAFLVVLFTDIGIFSIASIFS